MAHIEFTDNYQDLSTQSGYQFKFFCECCGNGYMSSFKASKAGMATGLLRGAGSMLGGFMGNAGNSADSLRDLIAGPAHDKALQEAVAEIRPLFIQCKRCGQWVCREHLLERRPRSLQGVRAHRPAGDRSDPGEAHRRAGRSRSCASRTSPRGST